MGTESLKVIAPLLKGLTIGELEAIRDIAWDIKYSLQNAEKEKLRQIIKDLEGQTP